MPRPGQVLGLVGTNGIGKSTALKVLAGKLKPNLGRFQVRFWEGGFRAPCSALSRTLEARENASRAVVQPVAT